MYLKKSLTAKRNPASFAVLLPTEVQFSEAISDSMTFGKNIGG